MKYRITLLFLLLFLKTFSQDDDKTKGLFYKISIAGTLTTNENFELGNPDSEGLIILNAFFFNNTFGLQIDGRFSAGLNLEYEGHLKQNLNFLPAYVSLRYVLFEYEDNFFIRGGYGRLLKLNDNFERGGFYKAGLGFQIYDADYRNSFLIGLDFTRKQFGFLRQDKISSVSIFLEFEVF
ncbi:MAG: hypothetical protein L3J45_04950 [Flavobacteriaceae bacterium]|nr:hypothetical protein [Flavobacteriaceae bacterium]